jgi:hypothetical protein
MSFFKDLKEDIAQSVDELAETFAEEEKAVDEPDVTVEDFPDEASMPDLDNVEEPAMMFTKPAQEAEIPSFDDAMTADAQEDSLEKALAYAAETAQDTDLEPEPEPEPVMEEAEPEPVIPDSSPEPEAEAEIEIPEISEPEPEPVMAAPEPEPVIEQQSISTPVMEETSMTMNAESMEDIDVSTDEVTVIIRVSLNLGITDHL